MSHAQPVDDHCGYEALEPLALNSAGLRGRGDLEVRSQAMQLENAVASLDFAIIGKFAPRGLAQRDLCDCRLAIGQPNILKWSADHGIAPDAVVTTKSADETVPTSIEIRCRICTSDDCARTSIAC